MSDTSDLTRVVSSEVEHPQETAEDEEGDKEGALVEAERLEFPLEEAQSPGLEEVILSGFSLSTCR